MELVCKYFLYFLAYAFLGYLCEVIYVSIGRRRLCNRGFLYGPICPIYGFGALIILLSLDWATNMWYVVLILGFILTTALEYLVSYLMELAFHMRWWDYSERRLNINGRVCLLNSSLFAGLVMLLVYLIHPYVVKPLIDLIKAPTELYIISGVLFGVFMIDTIVSTINTIDKAKLILRLEDKILAIENKKMNRISDIDTRIIKRLRTLNNKYPTLRVKSKIKRARIRLYDLIIRLEDKLKGE